MIGSAFEDLEALMTSAKEVIAMAERFASTSSTGSNTEATRLLTESASAMGLMTTKDMLTGGSSGSAAEKLYITQLSRDLAEYLTDDAHGVLRKEGGIMTLVDLWAVFNRRRNGIELISPSDFSKAVHQWEDLKLPLRLRHFKSGVSVVQGRDRTDEKTTRSITEWLHSLLPSSPSDPANNFGQGVTALHAAEHFGWSLGVAAEELEMAEDRGALVRDQDTSGLRFWLNVFDAIEVDMPSLTEGDEAVFSLLRSEGLV